MRIAQVAPLYESVPPKMYGGTERVVSWLTEELVAAGHEVTLFASGDSKTEGELRAVVPDSLRQLRLDPGNIASHVLLIEKIIESEREFDIIHSHIDYLFFPAARRLHCPVITTLHGRMNIPGISGVFREFADLPLISISDAQRFPAPDLNWHATVYHGLPADLYSLENKERQYLLHVGRISPEKGTHIAIEIAKRAELPLIIAGKVDLVDEEYFSKYIEPELGKNNITYIGEVNDGEKNVLYNKAIAFLFPITEAEAFGLVMIESMACGTPVIAFGIGSAPEVIEEGKTGFLCRDLNDCLEAIAKSFRFNHAQCRQIFLRRFSVETMAASYLSIYKKLLQKNRVECLIV